MRISLIMGRLAALLIAGSFSLSAEAVVIKYATFAPEGSIWAKYIQKWKSEVEKESNGEIQVRVFYGGVAGDEKVTMNKVKSGILHVGSFTSLGLNAELPMCRVLDLPFFYDNYRQIDATVKHFEPQFAAELQKRDLILGGWGEVGYIYLMTKKPVAKAADMAGQRIWAPTGDLLVKTMLEKYGLVPVFLGFESVLPALQTGGLDAVYNSPTGAVGLQWFREVKYYTDARLANITGATVFSKKKFDTLKPEHQKLLLDITKKHSREMVVALRADNEKSLQVMKNNGIKAVTPEPAEVEKFRKFSLEVQEALAGKLYSAQQLADAKRIRDANK